MMNVVEFFRNLPKKQCSKCGSVIQEQADCYGNTCQECDSPAR
ncbi:protein YhfH [Salimicrobium flavidum]|nr:protein YhfH [Salimicrobium flavidum]